MNLRASPFASRLLPALAVLLFALFGGRRGEAATLPFQFTMDETATTSAGIYKTDGTLVRTLWRKVEYPAGTQSASWDGLDDQGVAAPAGSYVVKMIVHHAGYVWEGAIGNTSNAQTGSTVHHDAHPMRDLTISGSDAFYLTGFCENTYDFKHFLTTNPQMLDDRWTWYQSTYNGAIVNHSSSINDRSWIATDTDGVWVYFASPNSRNPASPNDDTSPGFVTASLVADHTQAYFTTGIPIINGVNTDSYPNGVRVGTQPGVSGLAVQKTGNYLAVAVQPDNKVYLLDKRTGAAIRSINVTAPTALAFASNGDLWVLSGTTAKRFASGSPTAVATISGLQLPLDIAVNPVDSSVAIPDAGTSQQLKCFSSTGAALWTLGQAGGYATNGPGVANDKFIFYDHEQGACSCVAFGSDGSIWLEDSGNRRLLHFNADRSYHEQIMWQPSTYSTSIDAANPSRVFSGYLEFQVDYTKPISQSWTLVKNWSANLPSTYLSTLDAGLRDVAALSNGRTYAIVSNSADSQHEMVELTSSGTRLTPIRLDNAGDGTSKTEFFTASGNLRRADLFDASTTNPPGTRTVFEEKPLTGFDSSGNPQWGAYQSLATSSAEATDPVNRCCSLGDFNIPTTSGNLVLSFDNTKTASWHLGAVQQGGSAWLWKVAPTVTSNVPLDGLGSFDIGDNVQYGGNSVFASGRHILYGYHGEFWDNAQAAQFMHYYDNGLFIGQFGEPSLGHEAFEGCIAGYAGNSAFSCLATVNNEIYVWANDESQHGPQRWHLTGTRTIREMSAQGTLGQTAPLALNMPLAGFPILLQAQVGNQRVSLTWQAVPGATSYNLKTSSTPGGPWQIVEGGVQGSGRTVSGLINAKKYYFTVSALVGGQESPDADFISAVPFDPSLSVEKAGQYNQPGVDPDTYIVDPTAPTVGKPALLHLDPLIGDLPLLSFGAGGYRIFSWSTVDHSDQINFPAGDPTSNYNGWKSGGFLSLRCQIGAVLGDYWGSVVNSVGTPGTIELNTGDTANHYLTLVVPAVFRDPQQFQVLLQPQGHPELAVSYTINDPQAIDHFLQFRFKGPVTLTFQRIVGQAELQAIFLDNAPVIADSVSGFQLWQQQNFSANALLDPTQSGYSADPDADGLSNLYEYATGTSPLNAAAARPTFEQILNLQGNNYLTLQFVRVRDAAATFSVGVSSDLANWTWISPDDPQYLVADSPDTPAIGLDTLTVRDISPLTTIPRFMRLKISLP